MNFTKQRGVLSSLDIGIKAIALNTLKRLDVDNKMKAEWNYALFNAYVKNVSRTTKLEAMMYLIKYERSSFDEMMTNLF
jgi:hypothetical protein